jgi:hypothetical protein
VRAAWALWRGVVPSLQLLLHAIGLLAFASLQKSSELQPKLPASIASLPTRRSSYDKFAAVKKEERPAFTHGEHGLPFCTGCVRIGAVPAAAQSLSGRKRKVRAGGWQGGLEGCPRFWMQVLCAV